MTENLEFVTVEPSMHRHASMHRTWQAALVTDVFPYLAAAFRGSAELELRHLAIDRHVLARLLGQGQGAR